MLGKWPQKTLWMIQLCRRRAGKDIYRCHTWYATCTQSI